MQRLGTLLCYAFCSFAAGPPAIPVLAQNSHPLSSAPVLSAAVSGVVVNSLTGKPLDGVHVTLVGDSSSGMPSTVYGAMSSAGGRFSITAVPPSIYSIDLERRGFLWAPGNKGEVAANGALELKPGDQLHDVRLEMVPRAIISGRVLDENGDPAMGVAVSAIPLTRQPMAQRFVPDILSNDRGEFRLSVPPGKYYVKARLQSLRAGGPVEIRTDGTVDSDYVETYYPSATETAEATPVEVKPGLELSSVDVQLAQSLVLSISGDVLGIPNAAVSVRINLEWGSDPSDASGFIGWPAAADGKFHLGHLRPGFYRIYAKCTAGGLEWQSQIAEVALTNFDVEGLSLGLSRGSDVTGMVELSGLPSRGKRTVTLQVGGTFRPERSHTGDVSADGTFRMKDVFPGRYRVLVEPLPENGYVKEVRIRGTVVPDGILDFSGGAEGAELKITLSADGGQVSGRVEDTSGRVLSPFVNLILFPDQQETPGFERWRFGELKSDSRYSFTGLAPGKYRLLATTERISGAQGGGGEIRDVVNQHRESAPIVDIKEGEKISKNLKIDVDEDENGSSQK